MTKRITPSIRRNIQKKIDTALMKSGFSLTSGVSVEVNYTKEKLHGDLSSNVALLLAKQLAKSPRELAEEIVSNLDWLGSKMIEKVEIAGPGFINFFLKKTVWYPIIGEILTKADLFGTSDLGKNQRILVEFVSANPTGPLHVGHGRGAAYGDSIVRLLKAVGYQVEAEYYINDAGRQIDILALSVWFRYLEICGKTLTLPKNAYLGEYITVIAAQIFSDYGNQLSYHVGSFSEISIDELQEEVAQEIQDAQEAHIDALISKAKILLGLDNYKKILNRALAYILGDIKEDLAAFRVNFDDWFSERRLLETGFVKETINRLKKRGVTYQLKGALWFKSTEFGDDKDRVLIRENGQPTYFATDAAYRLFIMEKRGFKKMVNVLGADHHGYVIRIRAVIQALGYSAKTLTVLLVQFAVLYRGNKKIQMSTRSGDFITLRALREEIGTDATRFFYVRYRSDQHMDFDLELAKTQSKDNPVYYVQYAFARIASVMRQLRTRQWIWDKVLGMQAVEKLKEEKEISLISLLHRYLEVVQYAAVTYDPHVIANYLENLAKAFHGYYKQHAFLIEDDLLRNARLNLIAAVQQIIKNGLSLLGVETLEVM